MQGCLFFCDHLSSDGRTVLVLSFNITMSHILRDLLKRAPFEVDWKRVTWGHFHGWARKQIIEAGIEVAGDRQDDQGDQDVESGNDWNNMLTNALEHIITHPNDLARDYCRPLMAAFTSMRDRISIPTG